EEYYDALFRDAVPGLPEAAAAEQLTPLGYMRKYGSFEIPGDQHELHERPVASTDIDAAGARRDAEGVYRVPGTAGWQDDVRDVHGHMPFIGDGSLGVDVDGVARTGFPTPSRKLELFSDVMRDWGWPEHTMPGFIKSHVHWEDLDFAKGERILVPTF